MKLIFTLMFSAFITICQSQDYKVVGATFDYSTPLDISKVIDSYVGQKVAIIAKVNAVCQSKGCWMTLTSTDSNEEVFVKFKNYGFFMPLDLAGQKVIAHGVVSKTSTSIDELRHYAEDAGKTKEEIMAITKPKEEYKMIAEGVVILD
ncbi:MAG: DUF4920 domain-containing protein [Saprospiraceae bacterium]